MKKGRSSPTIFAVISIVLGTMVIFSFAPRSPSGIWGQQSGATPTPTTGVTTATPGLLDRPLVSDQCLRHGGDGAVAANEIVTERLGDAFYLVGDLESDVRDQLPLLASRVMVAAAHEAHAAIRILLGHPEP